MIEKAAFLGKLCSREIRQPGCLVDFSEIHTFRELQPGDLSCPKLNFQIRLQNGNVNRLALVGRLAFSAKAIELQIAVVGFHKFVDNRDHGVIILVFASRAANRSKTLENPLVCSRQVTLLESHYFFVIGQERGAEGK